MDFGLARALNSIDDDPFALDGGTSDDPFSAAVTRHGEVVGTPAYMSPEQQRGGAITAATDQYSFCVALFEALHGVRPFRAKTRRELFREKATGIFEHPQNTDVPRRIRSVVDRGLQVDPDLRFADMDALVSALERVRRPVRRGPMLSAVGGLGAAAIAAAWWPAGDETTHCSSEEALEGIWGEARRQQVQQVVTSKLGPNAPAQLDKLQRRLDDYATAWRRAYARACKDTETSERDATMACLGAARSELEGVLEAMVAADDPLALASATAATWALPSVAHCGESLGFATDTTVARRGDRKVQQLEDRLERARGLRSSGQAQRALEMAQRLIPRARELGDERVVARGMLLAGEAMVDLARYDEAREQFEAAYATALDASLFLFSADAATALVGVEAELGSWSAAEKWAEHAASWLRRSDTEPRARLAALGRARSELAADRGDMEGSVRLAEQALELAREEFSGPRLIPYVTSAGNAYLRHSDFARAKNQYAEALTLAHEAYGEGHLSTAPIINNLAAVYYAEFDFGEAATLFGRAYDIEAAVFAEDDPRLAANLSNHATALAESGRFEEAEPKLRRAIDMFERLYGRDHPRVGSAWTNLGSALHSMGRLEEAREAHTTAIEVLRDGFGPEHPTTLDALGNLASVERALGNIEVAKRLHTEVLEIRMATLGPDHAAVALALDNLGDLELDDGHLERAQALHEQALKIYTEASGPESAGVAGSHYHLGKVFMQRGDPKTARKHLEASLRIREQLQTERSYRGRTRFWLAKALDDLGEDPARARQLARRALEDFESMPADRFRDEVREIRGWLARRPGADAATLRPL
jgi:tetratricopeptide (TPR) repeat protein